MKVIKLSEHCIQVDFESQRELAETFVRFQEHYESPKFKNIIFTLDSFKTWYSRQKGSFSYYEDWSGFNIPSKSLRFFRSGLFDPLTEQEKMFLEKIPEKQEPFYIIGTFQGGKEDVLEHEKCHALYYTNEQYKDDVQCLLSSYPLELEPLEQHLKELGYHEDVLLDECHAYISASEQYLITNGISYPKLTTQLQELRRKYENKLP